ncbi:MAG: hypothetical protein E6J28_14165 [Chloroflexi bacterium]|nr:MAG: hypothetical protein E6J28_14165 [Chloroflexota bacterium]
MDVGQQPAAWHELAATFATIAAALFGLFFVAMALHLDAISTNVTVRARARVSLQSLALSVVQSLLILVPRQPPLWLGIELITTEIVYVMLGAGLRVRAGITALIAAMPIAAGISLIAGHGPGLLLQVPAIIIGVVLGCWQAWNTILPAELQTRRTVTKARR